MRRHSARNSGTAEGAAGGRQPGHQQQVLPRHQPQQLPHQQSQQLPCQQPQQLPRQQVCAAAAATSVGLCIRSRSSCHVSSRSGCHLISRSSCHGQRRLCCRLCQREWSDTWKRACEHFTFKRESSKCSHDTMTIWRRLHGAGWELPSDLLERVQCALEEENNESDHDADVQDIAKVGRGGAEIGGHSNEGVRGQPDSGPRSVAIGGSGGSRPAMQQAMGAGCSCPLRHEARVCGPAKQTSIVRYTKNPRQEEIDDSACEFFVENAILFSIMKSRNFKKFQLTCYGPQPAASKPLVPTGYNSLRCRLLDRLCNKLEKEEQAIRDDWDVTGCTFITDGTTDLCGRSLMNYILAGRSKLVFIRCEDVSVGGQRSPPEVSEELQRLP
ncbi:hypothetical protein CBR_g29731 [Chara braunii]|uniref:DUF659 domain-containing protein n=1 Tax=Chara braunii TaxID=69332 RepID=A0A388LBC3_CHABU|nr:hypothetical protein CBR_g29731 [Chara braunii]|eukprot:GBG79584.1 hypothetical protein CBR_g29731 [Chara braunii]